MNDARTCMTAAAAAAALAPHCCCCAVLCCAVHRRRGIGAALLAHLLARAGDSADIYLTTLSRTARFYEQQGFVVLAPMEVPRWVCMHSRCHTVVMHVLRCIELALLLPLLLLLLLLLPLLLLLMGCVSPNALCVLVAKPASHRCHLYCMIQPALPHRYLWFEAAAGTLVARIAAADMLVVMRRPPQSSSSSRQLQ